MAIPQAFDIVGKTVSITTADRGIGKRVALCSQRPAPGHWSRLGPTINCGAADEVIVRKVTMEKLSEGFMVKLPGVAQEVKNEG